MSIAPLSNQFLTSHLRSVGKDKAARRQTGELEEEEVMFLLISLGMSEKTPHLLQKKLFAQDER